MKKRKYIVIAVVYMALIFFLSSLSVAGDCSIGRGLVRWLIQNLLHIPIFGLLAFFWVKACMANGLQPKKAFIYSIVITIGYGAFDEFHQYFVPGRCATFGDFLLNTVGCAIGVVIYQLNARHYTLNANR